MIDTSYRRSAVVLWRNVGPEVFITRPESGDIDVLSSTAADVWRLLGRTGGAREIAARLPASDGEADRIASDVNALLGEFVRRGYAESDGG